jgi:transcriptional regulator with XRE-family HTH domain
MDVGATLRNARERRGLSLEDLSRLTKIKPGLLREIENSAFHLLPAGIFRRGFLRSYAREVGLNPELIVQCYLEEIEGTPAVDPSPTPEVVLREIAAARTMSADDGWGRPRTTAQWTAVALFVAVFAGYTMFGPGRSGRTPRSESNAVRPGPARASAAPAAGHVPVGTTGSVLQIDIVSTGPCWLSATSNGERIAYELLRPGDRRVIRARDGVVLRVGDPTAVAYTINGVPGRPLGHAAQPVTVRIAPGNFRDFLAAPSRTGS